MQGASTARNLSTLHATSPGAPGGGYGREIASISARVTTPSDIEPIDGVPVTKALRTLMDVADYGDVSLEEVQRALTEAAGSGKITRAEIAAAKRDAVQRDVLRRLQGGDGKR